MIVLCYRSAVTLVTYWNSRR